MCTVLQSNKSLELGGAVNVCHICTILNLHMPLCFFFFLWSFPQSFMLSNSILSVWKALRQCPSTGFFIVQPHQKVNTDTDQRTPNTLWVAVQLRSWWWTVSVSTDTVSYGTETPSRRLSRSDRLNFVQMNVEPVWHSAINSLAGWPGAHRLNPSGENMML